MDVQNISSTKVENGGNKNTTILLNLVDVDIADNDVTISKSYDNLTADQKTKFDDFVTWFSTLTE